MKRVVIIITALCFALSSFALVGCGKKEEPTPEPVAPAVQPVKKTPKPTTPAVVVPTTPKPAASISTAPSTPGEVKKPKKIKVNPKKKKKKKKKKNQ